MTALHLAQLAQPRTLQLVQRTSRVGRCSITCYDAPRSSSVELEESASKPRPSPTVISPSPCSTPLAPTLNQQFPNSTSASSLSSYDSPSCSYSGDHFLIKGRRPLHGFAPIGGAKNSVLVLMAAALLSDSGPLILTNVPRLRDIDAMSRVLESVGCTVQRVSHAGSDSDSLLIDASSADRSTPDPAQIRELRASFLVIAPLLSRFGTCQLALPGGCDIGQRPVDLHVKGLRDLGASVIEDFDSGFVTASGALKGGTVRLAYPSVGATETLLLAAVKARGRTRIENAAREPEVRDLALLLRRMGARITGEGTDTLEVEGVPRLSGVTFEPIPDRIEAGTMLVAAAASLSSVRVGPVIAGDILPLTDLLNEMGFRTELHPREGEPSSTLSDISIAPPPNGRRPLAPPRLVTGPFPKFPTDLQPLVVALLTTCEGACIVEERVFDSRFGYTAQLQQLGARVSLQPDGRTCLVEGVAELQGCDLAGSDLRAAAALVVAALSARGESRVFGLSHLDRGYDRLENKLRALGADLQRLTDCPEI